MNDSNDNLLLIKVSFAFFHLRSLVKSRTNRDNVPKWIFTSRYDIHLDLPTTLANLADLADRLTFVDQI